MSAVGPSRHLAATQHLGRFWTMLSKKAKNELTDFSLLCAAKRLFGNSPPHRELAKAAGWKID
jgi:hypothetical protein